MTSPPGHAVARTQARWGELTYSGFHPAPAGKTPTAASTNTVAVSLASTLVISLLLRNGPIWRAADRRSSGVQQRSNGFDDGRNCKRLSDQIVRTRGQGRFPRRGMSARRHHLRADLGRLPVSGRRAGCLLTPHRRLGDGPRSEDPARARRPQHGTDPEAAGRRHSSNPGRRHSALGYQSPVNYERSAHERLESVSP